MKYVMSLLVVISFPVVAMDLQLLDKKSSWTMSGLMQHIFGKESNHARSPHPDSLCKMRKKIMSMSYEDTCYMLKNMPTPLLQLTCAVVCLPKEIVKRHILSVLFDGHTQAIEQFYIDPPAQALTTYYSIKKKCGGKPIGPLYMAEQSTRDAILAVLHQQSQNVVPEISKNMYVTLKDEHSLRKLYVKDKTARVIIEGRTFKIAAWIFIAGFFSTVIIALLGAMAALGLDKKNLLFEDPIVVICNPITLPLLALIWFGTFMIIDPCHADTESATY